eukprot:TRINITY_DN36164_c0_g1_i1.p1 TRINITY_DN36164_c0_g1~~TRINITY_DN36164_c0_g1_i1.p1  ORF type:complete len:342 (+),score=48.15 TRINITY_DN36164_c0_g1_i1:95-1027(+)
MAPSAAVKDSALVSGCRVLSPTPEEAALSNDNGASPRSINVHTESSSTVSKAATATATPATAAVATVQESPSEQASVDLESPAQDISEEPGCNVSPQSIGLEAPLVESGQQSRQRNLAILLTGVVVFAMATEFWLMSLDTVPLLFDKIFFGVALVFQVLMLLSSVPLCEGLEQGAGSGTLARFRSNILDIAHWAFVSMVFSGPIVLRSSASLLFELAIAGASLVLRMSMRHECIITAVADQSSLPNISGQRVTLIFQSLFAVIVLRLLLELVFGSGFPWDNIIHSLDGNSTASSQQLRDSADNHMLVTYS